MVGSVFQRVIVDLEREVEVAEGFNSSRALLLRAARDEMHQLSGVRMERWLSMKFPYGSEFPWDSTGHEE